MKTTPPIFRTAAILRRDLVVDGPVIINIGPVLIMAIGIEPPRLQGGRVFQGKQTIAHVFEVRRKVNEVLR
jgi:hypothetical protein